MSKISVIIPTYNRPELLKRAIASVLAQTFSNWELIVVDDGSAQPACLVAESFKDPRIRCIRHENRKNGAAARNTGIQAAKWDYIAFLDDDDEWLPSKLEIQIKSLERTSSRVGFCFSAVTNKTDEGDFNTVVPEGIADYHDRALGYFAGFLTVTLLVRRQVFEAVGFFDEKLPSHQEPELMIRITRKYKGVAINQPLVRVNMKKGHEQIGKNTEKRAEGLEYILVKHQDEYRAYPELIAHHYFRLGLFRRDNGQWHKSYVAFKRSFIAKPAFRTFVHLASVRLSGYPYRLIRRRE